MIMKIYCIFFNKISNTIYEIADQQSASFILYSLHTQAIVNFVIINNFFSYFQLLCRRSYYGIAEIAHPNKHRTPKSWQTFCKHGIRMFGLCWFENIAEFKVYLLSGIINITLLFIHRSSLISKNLYSQISVGAVDMLIKKIQLFGGKINVVYHEIVNIVLT